MKKLFTLLAAITLLGNVAYSQLGNVVSYQKISDTQGDFTGTLIDTDWFGEDIDTIGDLDNNGVTDLIVGSRLDDDGGTNRGAVWVLFMNTNGTVASHQKISSTQGGFSGILNNDDQFGYTVACLGDLNGDNISDIAVGANRDDDGGAERGAIWILFLNANGTVNSFQKISDTQGGFNGTLGDGDFFGNEIANIGDINGDSVTDIAVGHFYDDDGGADRGAIWILFLNSNGTVLAEQKISDTQGGFLGTLADSDRFGSAITYLGDLNGDTIPDIAVGAPRDNDGGTSRGAVWILFLNTNGLVQSYQKISDTQGGFMGTLTDDDEFGTALSGGIDLNNDGLQDLIVGALLDDDGGIDRGAIWLLFLQNTGMVASSMKVSDTTGNFGGILDDGDTFGSAVGLTSDLNGDGLQEIAVGARKDDDGGTDRGCVWILFTCQVPIAGFTADTSNGTSVQFTDTSSSATGWQWDFGDFQSSSLQNPLHIYATTGWFYVCLIISDSCGSDTLCDSIYVSESVGIGQLANGNNHITIYPNPTTGLFTIQGATAPSLHGRVNEIQIFDLFGRLLLRSNEPEIDMSSYPAGIYIVKAGEVTRKLIIQ